MPGWAMAGFGQAGRAGGAQPGGARTCIGTNAMPALAAASMAMGSPTSGPLHPAPHEINFINATCPRGRQTLHSLLAPQSLHSKLTSCNTRPAPPARVSGSHSAPSPPRACAGPLPKSRHRRQRRLGVPVLLLPPPPAASAPGRACGCCCIAPHAARQPRRQHRSTLPDMIASACRSTGCGVVGCPRAGDKALCHC
jgi:hypothetical protein